MMMTQQQQLQGSSTPFAQPAHQQQCAGSAPVAGGGGSSGAEASSDCTTAVCALADNSSAHQHQHQGCCSPTSGCTTATGVEEAGGSNVHGSPAAVGGPSAAAAAASLASRYAEDREWLYRLITFPSYFTPCSSCCGSARTPKREQLMTQFDTEYPYRVYCSHCPECKDRINSGMLLQVRRSAFKDVVKASDILRYGADVAGVQQYTLNGSKVIYLNREQTPEKKGNNTNAAPAACSVDGRAMMDKSSSYCSLKCKLIAEDVGFTAWLDKQDPSVRILAQAAANAPPRPTAASNKRPAAPSSSSGASSGGSGSAACSDGSNGACSGAGATSRPLKCARVLGISSMVGDSAAAVAASAAAGAAAPTARPAAGLQRSASAAAASTGAPAGLKRIRISLSKNRRQSAPSGVLDAAFASTTTAGPRSAAAGTALSPDASCSSWMDLDNALSCSSAWEGWDIDAASLDSPCAAAGASFTHGSLSAKLLADTENDGSMSPALINAPTVFRSGSADESWWLCGSPLDGAFTCAGMGALLNTEGSLGGSGSEGFCFGRSDSLTASELLAPLSADTTTAAGLACW